MAVKIHQRIEQIEAVDTVNLLVQYSVGRCHRLSGNRQGQYAMDLVHPYRLVFVEKDTAIEIQVISIEDYH